MNFALFKDVNEEGPFHFLSGHGLEVRIQTLMCSYCITSQLMVTCLYVLGLIERFISCQQLQVDRREWRLWGITKRSHRHLYLWLLLLS